MFKLYLTLPVTIRIYCKIRVKMDKNAKNSIKTSTQTKTQKGFSEKRRENSIYIIFRIFLSSMDVE